GDGGRRRRRRGGRGRKRRTGGEDSSDEGTTPEEEDADGGSAAPAPGADDRSTDQQGDADDDADDDGEDRGSSRRRRRRRRGSTGGSNGGGSNGGGSRGEGDGESREDRQRRRAEEEVTGLKGSTRLEAKRQRRRDGRDGSRRRPVLTEAEFLARRESVERSMVVRERGDRTQIAVLEDGVLVEHYVARRAQTSMVGNVYLGKVQNVLPSMEAAFVDVGRGRNAVLYAGEVNWDAAGLDGQPRRIELALKAGDPVLVQVTKDPVGHKGARLTSQVSLPGRYLVYVPNGSMTGISRKLPDTERTRLKKILKAVVPEHAGVIVRTAAEGASEDELRRDVERLQEQWAGIEKRSKAVSAPSPLSTEPDLAVKVVRDVFNEDFARLVVEGDDVARVVTEYLQGVAPDLADRVVRSEDRDAFATYRVDEQIAKALDRKVWLPSGGSLVIDRTEAMTVVDVNTGKFTGSGGNLEETVTKNNLEAAEEVVRQLRLRDIGGIIVVDFIDMVLESNRDLVLRRLVECLGRDRTKHQVAEVTSLGLVQMTRKRVGQGLIDVFSEPCEACHGRGVLLHDEPLLGREGGGSDGRGSDGRGSDSRGSDSRGRASEDSSGEGGRGSTGDDGAGETGGRSKRSRRGRGGSSTPSAETTAADEGEPERRAASAREVAEAIARVARASRHEHEAAVRAVTDEHGPAAGEEAAAAVEVAVGSSRDALPAGDGADLAAVAAGDPEDGGEDDGTSPRVGEQEPGLEPSVPVDVEEAGVVPDAETRPAEDQSAEPAQAQPAEAEPVEAEPVEVQVQPEEAGEQPAAETAQDPTVD
ncbi:Rne/Rng family ribonuclease, partial [Pseudokineococcus sp. 1T1Z-3]|uniref:Rne/Rng family ribonuclease n=1 Tax=Pseudokineococcus sp. 1T1Z-3 TaxID=3132745 RepID=UPI0030A8E2A9